MRCASWRRRRASRWRCRSCPTAASRAVSFSRSEKRLAFYAQRRPLAERSLHAGDSGRARPCVSPTSLQPDIDAADLVDTQVVRFKSFDGMAIPTSSTSRTRPRQAPRRRPSSGSTAAPAGRPRAATAPSRSTSPTTATSCWASTTAAARATARRSSRRTTRSTAASRSGTASRPRSTSRPSPTWTPTASASSAAATAATWCSPRSPSSRTSSTSASTSSACRTGCARSRASRRGGRRSARRSTPRSATRSHRRRCCARSRRRSTRDKIRKPLIVLQGANDPRVIKAESDDIVAAVKKNGVPVEYVVLRRRGPRLHASAANEIAGYGAILRVPRRAPQGQGQTDAAPSAGQP